MSEKIKSEMISRREAFSLLGLAAALSVAVPVTIMKPQRMPRPALAIRPQP